MTDAPLVVFFLCVISLCVVVMTYTVVLTAADLRRVLRQLDEVLTRANEATARVMTVVHEACNRAAAMLDQMVQWKDRAGHFWKQHIGNGVRGEPRAHVRRR